MDSFPDWRFRAADYLACAAAGALAAGLSRLLASGGWLGPIGMPAGMLAGMLALVPVLFLFGLFSSTFEIVMPGMPAAMLAGMLGAMGWPAGPGSIRILGMGAAVGLLIQFVFHLYDLTLRGEVRGSGRQALKE